MRKEKLIEIKEFSQNHTVTMYHNYKTGLVSGHQLCEGTVFINTFKRVFLPSEIKSVMPSLFTRPQWGIDFCTLVQYGDY